MGRRRRCRVDRDRSVLVVDLPVQPGYLRTVILRYLGDGDPLDVDVTVERSLVGIRVWLRGRSYRPESLSSLGFVIVNAHSDERELLGEGGGALAFVELNLRFTTSTPRAS